MPRAQGLPQLTPWVMLGAMNSWPRENRATAAFANFGGQPGSISAARNRVGTSLDWAIPSTGSGAPTDQARQTSK
jgi:hypothetical protein